MSSAFDLLTFGLLRTVFQAGPELFRTGWFVESLLTELAIALVVRTQRPFFRSQPGRLLLVSTLVLVMVTFAIPFLPFASLVGFVPLSPLLVATIVVVMLAYALLPSYEGLVLPRTPLTSDANGDPRTARVRSFSGLIHYQVLTFAPRHSDHPPRH